MYYYHTAIKGNERFNGLVVVVNPSCKMTELYKPEAVLQVIVSGHCNMLLQPVTSRKTGMRHASSS